MTRRWWVPVDGSSGAELRARLLAAGVQLNEAAEVLLRALPPPEPRDVAVVVRTVAELGLPDGGTTAEVFAAARPLRPGPLALAAHLRLVFLDQPESSSDLGRHRAPPGSLTIATPRHPDDDHPQGFYLRRVDGALWLRGFRCGPEHVWSPDDAFGFVAEQ